MRDRIGGEGDGWPCAKYLLGYERGGIAGVGSAKKLLRSLTSLLAREGLRPEARLKLQLHVDRLSTEVLCLEATSVRLLAQSPSSAITPSILKITGTELRQELAQLIYEYSGASDMVGMTINGVTVLGSTESRPNPALDFLDSRKLSIYGGTNEIQRNIIAKSVLGD